MILYSKNIGGEKTLENLANYSILPSFIANFYDFHNIPYANGLQFAKGISAKLPTVLVCQTFLPPKFLLYAIIINNQVLRKIKIVVDSDVKNCKNISLR